jgi:GntR family transcriptional regulator/MocR family aminotransferase
MHVTVRLVPSISKRIDDVALSARAAAEGLVLLPLSGQYAAGAGEHGFLLGYAGWSETQFDEALERLIALLRNSARG